MANAGGNSWEGLVRHKVIFILIDGLTLSSSRQCMSCLNVMIKGGIGHEWVQQAVLPPLSRPAYATLLYGISPLDHGILSNDYWLPLSGSSFFHIARDNGLKTAAAAYKWFFELCWGKEFNLCKDRFINDLSGPIQHALFYSDDCYPDRELFADAEALRKNFDPDLLLVHCMGVDWAGHREGSESKGYLEAVRGVDGLLAAYIPGWVSNGYKILITADHGMDKYGSHYDNNAQCREVPVYVLGEWLDIPLPYNPCEIKRFLLAGMGL